VHSSTSSSERFVPVGPWPSVLAVALLIASVFAALMELGLAARGFERSINDSAWLWRQERERASELGERALILIGGSRMQLDIDLDVLREQSGLEPVQLAIDGSSFMPVLEGLAADPTIIGTVWVDYADHLITDSHKEDKAAAVYQREFERVRHEPIPPLGEDIEGWLVLHARDSMRSLADGARPIDSLLSRLLNPAPTAQYLLTRRDRSRAADYSKVEMPEFALMRALRNMGDRRFNPDGLPPYVVQRYIEDRIATLQPAGTERFMAGIQRVRASVDCIQSRGGKVIFIVLPKSGYVKAIDDKLYPREQFWDTIVSMTGTRTLHFEDHEKLRQLNCPDGSHLDQRDRAPSSLSIARELGMPR